MSIKVDFADVVHKLGRVRVLPYERDSAVEVRARIAARSQWLRRTCLPRLDAELGVTFPLVTITPVCWYHELKQGVGGYVKARVGPFVTADGVAIWSVQLCAVAPLEFSDSLLEGVLAHEFLHYVYLTQFIAARADQEDHDLTHDAFDGDYAHYRARDKERAADPDKWLTPRLKELMVKAEGNSPATKTLHERIATTWVKGGLLPVEKMNPDYKVDEKLVLDESIASRRDT